MKKTSTRKNVKKRVKKCSIGVVSAATSICFITGLGTNAYAQERHNTAIEQQVSVVNNSSINTMLSDSEAEAKVNAVKKDLAAVTYEELYPFLNPYVRFDDKIKITNELRKELGRNPTEDEVNARVKIVYMDKIDLIKSFNKVQSNLDTILKNVFKRSSYVDTNYVIARKYEVLLGLSYLDRQYSFSFNGISAKDLILYNPEVYGTTGDALNRLINIGTVSYADVELQNNLTTYSKKIAPITKETNILDFIEKSLKKYEPNITASDWFKRESKAYIVEVKSEYADTSLYNKMKHDARLRSHLIPLLTLSEDSIYAISTMSTVNYGLVDTYVDRNNDTTKETFKRNLEETAKKQEAFLDFWYRVSDVKEKLFEGNDILIIDTMQKYGQGSASSLWVPGIGTNTITGVREFMTPFKYYSSYMFADGQASGDMVNLFLAKSLTDRGQATYTHELTHILDNKVWLNGYGRRNGKGGEVFAAGLFESVNNTLGESQYEPIFNLNLTYNLGNGRVQNASPTRFMKEADLKEYMQGLMDVIYTLDYAEAKASLEKTADEKAVLFNQLELTPDTNPQAANQVKDTFKNINTDVANSLTTINDLIEKNIVSGRLTFKGNQTTGTAESNGYYVVPLFQPIYAAVQNNAGAVGDITFKRYAYELLAEYGYKNGMVSYVSNQYVNDEEALKAILDNKYNGSLKEFKKDMFARRISKLSDLKETDYFTNYDELQNLMNDAVDKDLAQMQKNKDWGLPITSGVTAVNTLKTKIFQWYLTNTNDFETSIYKGTKPPATIVDIAKVAEKYNLKKGEPKFDEEYDLNNDGIIDIYDIVIVAKKM